MQKEQYIYMFPPSQKYRHFQSMFISLTGPPAIENYICRQAFCTSLCKFSFAKLCSPNQTIFALSTAGDGTGEARRMAAESPTTSSVAERLRPFVRGGLAGCSGWLFVHPMDLIKTRAQVIPNARSLSILQVSRQIIASEGLLALYSGLSAALTRQAVYTTLRLGFYQTIRDAVTEPGQTVSAATKLAVGLVAGGIASAISTPVEVSMVRMYADGGLPADQKRGYRHIGDAIARIAREEGIATLWRGAGPTVARAMVVNCVQLGV